MDDGYISYSEIRKQNGGSRWKTDKVIDYFVSRNEIIPFLSKQTTDQAFMLNGIKKNDLKYKSTDFEPPIGKREWIAWGLAALSIVASVLIAIFN